jgi:threonyl-tRNA synthetase
VVILPLTVGQHDKAVEIAEIMCDKGFRCSIDRRNETIGYRIRAAESRKVPFMLVIGEREALSGNVAVRAHGRGDLGVHSLEQALGMIEEACRRPALPEGGRSLSEIP